MNGAAVRVGVIGKGFGARAVAPVFAATDGCGVVDVVSARDGEAVRALCARADVDLVSVHSPPFLHAEHVLAAIEAGHAVLCDKPFGRSAADAASMLAAAEVAGVVNLLNFEFRYDPIREALRELVLDGAIGAVEQMTWTVVSSGSRVPLRRHGWLFERALGGGWIGAWGSHAVDTVRWMLGEVSQARAELRTSVRERPDRDGVQVSCDAEDGFTAWLHLHSGAAVLLDGTYAAPASLAPRIVLIGSEGVLECVADARVIVRRSDGTRDDHEREAQEPDPHLVPMRRWAQVVRDAVRAGSAPEGAPTFADGLACARVLDALRG